MDFVKGIKTAEDLQEGDLVIFTISRNEIELCATYRFEEQIIELKKVGMICKNQLMISVDGYDFDPREVYEIPEVRKYFKQVFNDIPEFLYFANIGSYTYAILVNCIFTKQSEVDRADKAISDYAKSIGDIGQVFTVSYYTAHHNELVSNGKY